MELDTSSVCPEVRLRCWELGIRLVKLGADQEGDD